MWTKWFNEKRQINDNDDFPLFDGIDKEKLPQHIAIIMDGNGRWAKEKGYPRTYGHKVGAETLREIVKTCSLLGIRVLTVYAFSTENWKRPATEVKFLMHLLSEYIENELEELHNNHVRIRFIGDTTVLAQPIQQRMKIAVEKTAQNDGLILNVAVNYGGRSEIIRAVKNIAREIEQGKLTQQEIDETVINRHLYTGGMPDPELLIRSSGDMRISNFLLWQLAYTELWLTDTHWPDFTPELLVQAIKDYQKRERRFGGLTPKK